MKVDHALILAAGKGTRMGEIGKVLPKVLWPIFEKSILELEVNYCHEFFTENVYVNLFNYKDIIRKNLEDRNGKSFNFIVEQDEIDIGGAVHNLARKLKYQGKLLVINSDQFIMLSKDLLGKFIESSEKFDTTILTYTVNKDELYNEILVENGRVIDLIPNEKTSKQEFETYTGMAIINLESLDPCLGKSKFFDSVANFKNKNIGAINISNSTYWDFGTLNRFYNSSFKILDELSKDSPDPFISFLKKYKAIEIAKVDRNSYFSKVQDSISLEGASAMAGNIVLTGHDQELVEGKRIIFENLVESLD